MSQCSKIFEKLLFNRVIEYLEKFKLLSTYQYGFRKNSSTIHAIADIHNNLMTTADKRLYCTTVAYFSINQFSGPAYPWGVAGAAAQVGASKHLDPLQQRIDALLGCQGETNYDLLRNLAIEFWDGL